MDDSEGPFASREQRHSVDIEGVAKHPNGSTVSIKLVDLSYDGCRIEIPVSLQPGDEIQITARGSISHAVVRWYSDCQAGLSFIGARKDSPERIETQPAARDEPRIKTRIEATMQRHGKSKYPVVVSDMSAAGCKVEFVDRPELDEPVHMRFTGLHPIEGKVRWLAGTDAGIQFHRPIHPAVFDLLARKYAGC